MYWRQEVRISGDGFPSDEFDNVTYGPMYEGPWNEGEAQCAATRSLTASHRACAPPNTAVLPTIVVMGANGPEYRDHCPRPAAPATTPTPASAPDWTPEDVERLASEVMGWTEVDPSRPGGPWKIPTGGGAWRPTWLPRDWNPFTNASDDYQVLEELRVSWQPLFALPADEAQNHPWTRFEGKLRKASRYMAGDYARAAIAVLKGGEQG